MNIASFPEAVDFSRRKEKDEIERRLDALLFTALFKEASFCPKEVTFSNRLVAERGLCVELEVGFNAIEDWLSGERGVGVEGGGEGGY